VQAAHKHLRPLGRWRAASVVFFLSLLLLHHLFLSPVFLRSIFFFSLSLHLYVRFVFSNSSAALYTVQGRGRW
jgi:hypothetical protein